MSAYRLPEGATEIIDDLAVFGRRITKLDVSRIQGRLRERGIEISDKQIVNRIQYLRERSGTKTYAKATRSYQSPWNVQPKSRARFDAEEHRERRHYKGSFEL